MPETSNLPSALVVTDACGLAPVSSIAMLVDVVKTDAWAGLRSLVRMKMADVLYTRDGVTMMRLPVKRNNWPTAMRVRYASVEEAAKDDVKLHQGRGQNKVDIFKQQGNMFSPRGRMMDGRRGDYMGPEGYMDPRMGGYRGRYGE